MMRKLCTAVTLSVLLMSHAMEAHSDAPTSAIDARTGIYDPSLDARVESLLSKMTLDEKVGQLVQYSAGQPTGPGTGRTDYEDMIAKGQIGALFNISTAKETNAYQRLAVEKSRLKIPIVFGLDVIHGFRTVFPVPLAMASTWDPALVEQAARVAARKPRQPGFAGRFLQWSTSPAMPAGAASRKAQEKTRSSVRRWRLPTFAATRERGWMHRIASPPAPSITSDTERPRAGATTTPPKSPNTPCVRSISRHFAPP